MGGTATLRFEAERNLVVVEYFALSRSSIMFELHTWFWNHVTSHKLVDTKLHKDLKIIVDQTHQENYSRKFHGPITLHYGGEDL